MSLLVKQRPDIQESQVRHVLAVAPHTSQTLACPLSTLPGRPSMRLTVTSDVDDQMGVVVAAGEVDLATVSTLRQDLSDHIAAGLTMLLVDLSAVTFIDSTGLGVLVGAGKKTAEVGGSMRLVCDNP